MFLVKINRIKNENKTIYSNPRIGRNRYNNNNPHSALFNIKLISFIYLSPLIIFLKAL